ncbi:Yip1 family protein [Oceanobacillus halophilus]|nr:Yip1 family protein [Oceanobacillus halophilus]
MSEEKKQEIDEVEQRKPSLFGMIWSPTEQFERIKEQPKIWAPLGIISVLFIVGTLITILGTDLGIEGFSEDEMAIFAGFAVVISIIVGVISPILGTLIISFIYWLIAKLARSEVSFKQLFSMNTYLMILSVLSLIINGTGIALLGGNPETIFTSLGSLIQAEGAIGALFDSIEVFGIWGVILTAIGLHKVADFSKGLAWTISIVFFVIGIIFAMIGAALSGMVGV